MEYKKFETEIVVILTTGDNIHESLKKICENENIMMGSVIGFGGVNFLKLGIWNNSDVGYDYLIKADCDMELTNLTGNISLQEGAPLAHIHVTAADNHFNMFGGHLVDGVVQNLMELYIYPGQSTISRIKRGSWYFMDLSEEAR